MTLDFDNVSLCHQFIYSNSGALEYCLETKFIGTSHHHIVTILVTVTNIASVKRQIPTKMASCVELYADQV